MRKISLFAGVVALSLGLGGVALSTSAFADGVCLNPDAGSVDLTHFAMNSGAGPEFDIDGYHAEMAKGNRCDTTTQQSQPISQTDYVVKGKKAQSTNN